jgi:Ulp1 family protease
VDKDRYGYEAVKKWTAKGKVDVFEKDLIIVPINEQ